MLIDIVPLNLAVYGDTSTNLAVSSEDIRAGPSQMNQS